MRRRTKNTSKKKKKKHIGNPQTHEPRIPVVANHGVVLLFALTEHKALMGQRLGKSNGSILGKFDGSVVSEGREGKKIKGRG